MMACAHFPFQFPPPSGLSSIIPTTFNRPSPLLSFAHKNCKASAFSSWIGSLRLEMDDNPEAIISGEWPDNFSLLSFNDLRAYLESHVSDDDRNTKIIGPSTPLEEVMSTSILAATPAQTLKEIDRHFELVSGLPVVDGDLRCIGVISKSDRAKAYHGLESTVGEVMSSPAITLSPNSTVRDAAALMLRMKIHRIPIVNEGSQVVGMVSRTDIFRALESLEEA